MAIPGPSEQLAFLRDLQRLLDEGQFTATYKFALLLALSDLSVERGDESGAPLKLSLSDIGERFIVLYWGHARPFPSANSNSQVSRLSQSFGQNIALLRAVTDVQNRFQSLAEVRHQPQWKRLVGRAARIVETMPLFKLQTLRRETKEFLYANELDYDKAITLKPGVAFNLRKFHVLIQHVVRGAWVRHIRTNPRNSALLGSVLDLEEFLFEIKRAQYPHVKEALHDLQQGSCFYCERRIRSSEALDHFIPWAKYPSDLGHNFVLADSSCNADKSDLLADLRLREKWDSRNEKWDKQLSEVFRHDAVPYDLSASRSIADWAYSLNSDAGTAVWVPTA